MSNGRSFDGARRFRLSTGPDEVLDELIAVGYLRWAVVEALSLREIALGCPHEVPASRIAE